MQVIIAEQLLKKRKQAENKDPNRQQPYAKSCSDS